MFARARPVHGANRAYLDAEIPHITELLAETVEEAVDGAETVLISSWDESMNAVLAGVSGRPTVLDTVGIPRDCREGPFAYRGICW